MSSKMRITGFTGSFSDNICRLRDALRDCDAVLIGAGAGLSAAAGFEYSGERFQKYFSDYEKKFGFHDMYSGGFYPYKTPEEFWAFWARYILINRYTDAPKNVYNELFELVRDKEYFVITTNVDHCFQKAGFDKTRLFYTQGDYGLFQCSVPCHNETYDNEAQVKEMVEKTVDMKIPTDLIPKCPVCGKSMTMNLRSDDKFVEDAGWVIASTRYEDFVSKYGDSSLVLLELGVGYNTPVIIKYPFWQITARNEKALYVCINRGDAVCPEAIASRSVCIDRDIGAVLKMLKE